MSVADATPGRGGAFGPYLRALRRSARLSQDGLAQRAGISQRTVSDLERGIWKTPRADTAALLADGLELSPAQRIEFFAVIERERTGEQGAPTPVPGLAPLPVPASRLLGREDAVDRLEGLLAPGGPRVVTLVGPGGVGKTRLAIEAARRRAFAGQPVAWIPLESLVSAEEVLPAIARAVDAPLKPGLDLVARIAAATADRRLLLVADNAEHLLDAAPDLSALSAAAPDVTLLVTSREALRIGGERTVSVDPLPVPAVRAERAELSENPAVALFLARIGLDAGPEASLPDVRRIVAAVDGLPLAIELAAAQHDSLSVSSIAGLLERSGLRLLDGGRRDVPNRLRTMERAVRWGYDLIDPAAQRLLRALSVFRGGFDVETAGELCEELGAPELVGGLSSLARASLVVERGEDGARRFAMLAPIRMFAEAELAAQGETVAARRAHLAVMLRLARRASAEALRAEAETGLATLDRERDNLLAALDRAVDARDARSALAMVAALSWWWEIRADIAAGHRWLERSVDIDDGSAAPSDAWTARWFAGQFASYMGLFDAAKRHAADAMRVAEAAHDATGIAVANVLLGDSRWLIDGDPAGAAPLFDAAVDALARSGPSVWLAHALARRGNLAAMQGDRSRALADLEGSLAVRAGIDNVVFRAMPLFLLGETLRRLGRLDDAAAAHREALGVGDRFGQPTPIALAMLGLAAVGAEADDAAAARRAALLLGAAERLVADAGIAYDSLLADLDARTRARASAALSPARVETLIAEGGALSLADALAVARGA